MMAFVEIRDLRKQYNPPNGPFAVGPKGGVSFEIAEGEIFSLLGPNGAGKTTTISIMSTLLAPTSGDVKSVGLLADVATAVRSVDIKAEKLEKITTLTEKLAAQIPILDARMVDCFEALDRFLMQHFAHRYDNTGYDLRLRITDAERVQPAWVNVEIDWDNTALVLKHFILDLDKLVGHIEDLSNYNRA